jgi:hypothetical protein
MMDIIQTMTFIQNVYDTYNISHSWIVYDKNEIVEDNLQILVNVLKNKDFPIFVLDSDAVSNIQQYEQRYRMFVIEKNVLNSTITSKNNNASNISVIFTLSVPVLRSVCKVLENLKTFTCNEMHLFSC